MREWSSKAAEAILAWLKQRTTMLGIAAGLVQALMYLKPEFLPAALGIMSLLGLAVPDPRVGNVRGKWTRQRTTGLGIGAGVVEVLLYTRPEAVPVALSLIAIAGWVIPDPRERKGGSK